MTWTDAVFIVAMGATLFGAWRVVSSKKLMHAALWLGFTFLGVAATFLLLSADFIAAAQVLIYVGAINTMIVFGVMLSAPQELRESEKKTERIWPRLGRYALPALAAGGFGVLMTIIYRRAAWPPPTPHSAVPLDTVTLLGRQLFSVYVAPFEAASLILLVALIGAIVIAGSHDAKAEGVPPKEAKHD